MSLTILLGDYGSGKTATAKYLAKQTGGEYIDVDLLSQRKGNYDSYTLLEKLKAIVKKPDRDYFMDGFPSGYSHETLTSETLGVKVKYIVCMAAPNIIRDRQIKKPSRINTSLPRNCDGIGAITYLCASIALTYDANPLFADTSTNPPTFWKKHNWFTRWLEIGIYAALKDAEAYQDVELSDRAIVGLSKSYKTWERLSALVGFNDRRVLDYGCNYGYFCFKAEDAGAASIIGVDESQTVLDMAASIAITKHSKAKFVCSELKNFEPPDNDITLALNIFHHLDYDKDVLSQLFKSTRMVVFEMPAKDLPRVNELAMGYHFEPIVASSHRQDRVIAIYTTWEEKLVILPRKFEYHPRREAFKKWAFHLIRKFLPRKGLGIARRIKRWLGK